MGRLWILNGTVEARPKGYKARFDVPVTLVWDTKHLSSINLLLAFPHCRVQVSSNCTGRCDSLEVNRAS